ncbi:MAG: putative manganese transporter [Candidatus Omnitrophota bacterium]|nr:putative manganese transporter [Candidatus Omnitrophota bacterium]
MSLVMDALIDTGKLVPLLALIYFFVGFLEYRYGDRISHFIIHIGAMGPVAGALVGCIPQCGFSVVASALYIKRLISVGTLLAVFLSTSDEAVPVLLSMPHKAGMVGLLIVIKVVIAVIAGVIVDYFIRVRAGSKIEAGSSINAAENDTANGHHGCCSHGLEGKRSKIKALILHPLRHTVKRVIFMLFLTLVLNIILNRIGEGRIETLLLRGSVFQPAMASLIGLIPNCFASVLLAKLFANGAISFGSMVAGLCSGAGLGLLVLIKENRDLKNTLFVIGLLLTISIFAGIVIQYAMLP